MKPKAYNCNVTISAEQVRAIEEMIKEIIAHRPPGHLPILFKYTILFKERF